ncbi:MAG: RNA 2',3'-cyclic phosphodiesterase [Archaeoglobi archaeon]|jgi:2'-5' RNA ligase|nr:MAG: RNA 2',3'-cyclic phosphodiesterase [Archaeoglobi archaeon]
MRLFVAVDIDEEVKKNIEPLLLKLSKLQGVKPVERENLHVTLMFLGEVDESRLDEIGSALSKVRFSPFRISLKGVGKFPERGDARVVWIGIEKEDDIRELAEKVYSELKRLGFRRDKEFVAHLTVARVKRKNREIEGVIKEFEENDFGEMLVRNFKLKQSILKPTGPVYKDVRIFEASS